MTPGTQAAVEDRRCGAALLPGSRRRGRWQRQEGKVSLGGKTPSVLHCLPTSGRRAEVSTAPFLSCAAPRSALRGFVFSADNALRPGGVQGCLGLLLEPERSGSERGKVTFLHRSSAAEENLTYADSGTDRDFVKEKGTVPKTALKIEFDGRKAALFTVGTGPADVVLLLFFAWGH